MTSHAPTVDEALNTAVSKLATVLARELTRRDHHKGSASIRIGSGDHSGLATTAEDDAERRIDIGPPEE